MNLTRTIILSAAQQDVLSYFILSFRLKSRHTLAAHINLDVYCKKDVKKSPQYIFFDWTKCRSKESEY